MQGGSGGAFYRYRSSDGRVVIVDSLHEVPEAQRSGAERIAFTASPAAEAMSFDRPWRFDWPSAALGFAVAGLLAVLFFASRRGSRWALGLALALGLGVLGTAAYFGFLRRSTGQSGSPFASPSAVIDDAKRAVDQMDRRNREQERQIRELQRESR
jgi:predicted membrane metal-binding protein